MELVQSPVKEAAIGLGLPIVQPATIKTNEEFRSQITALKPDAIIVVGYGRIIPQWMIDLPRFGNLNLHGSLLPKYRGAAPIQWAIARGESVTGVTTMRIDAGLDTGDILLQRESPISRDDTAETLAPRLASIGAELMVETVARPRDGADTSRAAGSFQSHAGADPEKRRWTHGFLTLGRRPVQSHARIPAVARRIYDLQDEDPASASG